MTDGLDETTQENVDLKRKIKLLEEELAALRAPTSMLGRIYGWVIHWSIIGFGVSRATEQLVNAFNQTKTLPAREIGQLVAAFVRRYTFLFFVSLALPFLTAVFLLLGWSEQQAQNKYLARQTDLLQEQSASSARAKYAEVIFTGWSRTATGDVMCAQRHPASLMSDYVIAYVALERTRANRITIERNVPSSIVEPSLQRACIDGLNAAGQNLSRVNFSDASLKSAEFNRAQLANADFSGANLMGADFFAACLRGARFYKANVSNVSFSGADLSSADLQTVVGYTPGMFDKSCGENAMLLDGRQLRPCSEANKCRE